MQVLLGAGLAFLCFCLILGCALCWRRTKQRKYSNDNKEQASEHIVVDTSPSVKTTTPIKQQYEEMEGEVLDFPPSMFNSLTDYEATSQHKPSAHGRASLPAIALSQKLNLVAKTKRTLERRCTVSGDGSIYDEHTKLTSSSTRLINPMLATNVRQSQTMPEDLSGIKLKLRPTLQFSLFYSEYETTLSVAVVSVSSLPKKYGNSCDSYVKVYLLPKFIEPQQTVIRRKSLNPEFRECFQFSGFTLEEIRCFTLRFAVYVKEFHSFKDTFIGEVLFPCDQGDWKADLPSNYTKELMTTKTKLKKCLSSQDVLSSTGAQFKQLGQMFILLQYQTLANRIKVMVRKAENLGKLTRMPGSPDHYVTIHLYHNGEIIATKETKSASGYNPVWNAPFLFDIPAGNIQEHQLSLEFIVMQGRIYTRNCVLGRVLIGTNASEVGLVHWKEMCNRGHVESARWHAIQPDAF
nr:PREDICTED: synaptotagmin-7-like [Latimeria chalumnae]|eukprot:XP_014349305.1 PREDICTED: synaptotagmin-7-like [Latimeria chalumnae]